MDVVGADGPAGLGEHVRRGAVVAGEDARPRASRRPGRCRSTGTRCGRRAACPRRLRRPSRHRAASPSRPRRGATSPAASTGSQVGAASRPRIAVMPPPAGCAGSARPSTSTPEQVGRRAPRARRLIASSSVDNDAGQPWQWPSSRSRATPRRSRAARRRRRATPCRAAPRRAPRARAPRAAPDRGRGSAAGWRRGRRPPAVPASSPAARESSASTSMMRARPSP